MIQKKRNRFFSVFLKVLPYLVIGIVIICNWDKLRNITFEDILHYTPKNLFLAALSLVGAYALKCLTIVFPLAVLYISAGMLFPYWLALLVNVVGLTVSISIPYFLGKFSGTELIQNLAKKHPKMQKLSELESKNEIFVSYLLRVVGILPGDLASMYMGATGMNYARYWLGSQLGLAPMMVIQTLLGGNIENPFSWQFLLLFILMVGISLLSARMFNRKQKK